MKYVCILVEVAAVVDSSPCSWEERCYLLMNLKRPHRKRVNIQLHTNTPDEAEYRDSLQEGKIQLTSSITQCKHSCNPLHESGTVPVCQKQARRPRVSYENLQSGDICPETRIQEKLRMLKDEIHQLLLPSSHIKSSKAGKPSLKKISSQLSPETRFDELGISYRRGSGICKPERKRRSKHIRTPSTSLKLSEAATNRKEESAKNLVDYLKPTVSALTFSKPPVIRGPVLGAESIYKVSSASASTKPQSLQSSMISYGKLFESKLTFV